ncbi:MAG: undecaprenyldiphospho-muramoylpentapeptide beta-N-acetylglucosaminyltransferase [Acidimicrobiia bacterium]
MREPGIPAVVIAGGGTGGHVFPALALAHTLVQDGMSVDAIHFIGAQRGLEATAVPAAGFAITLLPGRGIQRRVTVANIVALWQFAIACFRALRLMRLMRPRVMVGVGGYASAPCVVAAFLLRIPMVVHEQNASPGVVNRVAVRLGARAAVAWPGTPLRKAIATGNPIRPEIQSTVRAPRHRQVVVMGGSLGAQRVNSAALALYDRWRTRDDLQIVHLCGARNIQACTEALAAARWSSDALDYRLVAFESDMASLYANTTLVVGRAGAVTVAELAAVGMPAILVPLPGAPGDHQGANARAFARAGAAVVLLDEDCNGARLGAEIEMLLDDAARLETMHRAALSLAVPDAGEQLAEVVRGMMRRDR